MVNQYMEEVISQEDIQTRIEQLGAQISRDYAGKKLILMSVLSGAFMFAADLCRVIDGDVHIDFIRVSSYGSSTSSSGALQFVQKPHLTLQGAHILIVEDIVDTGGTVQWLRDYFTSLEVESVRLCALIDKKERRQVDVIVDYIGFALDQGFLIGYGLDFAEKYRNLPALYSLKE